MTSPHRTSERTLKLQVNRLSDSDIAKIAAFLRIGRERLGRDWQIVFEDGHDVLGHLAHPLQYEDVIDALQALERRLAAQPATGHVRRDPAQPGAGMTRMTQPKIVFTGPPGAGKTTAIAMLSDIAPVVTDVRNTDPALAREFTTVGLDFGQADLAGGRCVQLFGTPGQLRFEFMWQIIAADALGLVILLDNSRPDPLDDLSTCLDAYQHLLPTMNCAVGIGRTAEFPQPAIDRFSDLLTEQGVAFPVLPVDVRRREDVLRLVDTVLIQGEMRAAA